MYPERKQAHFLPAFQNIEPSYMRFMKVSLWNELRGNMKNLHFGCENMR